MKLLHIVFEYTDTGHSRSTPTILDPKVTNWDLRRTYDISMDQDGSHWGDELAFELRTFNAPDWMTNLQFVAYHIQIRHLHAYGANWDWPQKWIEELLQMPSEQRYFTTQLLKSVPDRMRSKIRKSIRMQIIQWMETDPESRDYRTPLSPRQLTIVAGPYGKRKLQAIDRSLYINRGWSAVAPAIEKPRESLAKHSEDIRAAVA